LVVRSSGSLKKDQPFIKARKKCDLRTVFDHVQIKVEDFASNRAFYESVLGTLGYSVVFEDQGVVGFGNNPHDMFEISQTREDAPASKSTHIAFIAKSEDAVRAFHKTALAHGAKENGAPGLRPKYEEGYFAAFVLDPNGHNLEAVYKVAQGD
jgi:catechol 2,3-dioxygenase-like lactoylglutathione lyase family enzyme